MEHQFTESSISKSNCIQHIYAVESDTDRTDRTDSKIMFDVNQLDLPITIKQKHQNPKCVPIMKQNIYSNPKYSSQSEQLLSPTSESSYECFYLDNSNNKEQSIIEQKKNNQINDIVIKDYFKFNNINIKNKISPIQIINKSVDRSSIDRSHINTTQILHSDNDINSDNDSDQDDDENESISEDNCFSLFDNDSDNSSDNEIEFKHNNNNNNIATYKISVPRIQIPKTKNELLKRVRPAFKLHLEMIDNDGSIKRQIIQHRKFVKKLNEKHNPNIYINNEYDDNINNNIVYGCNKNKNKKKNKYGRKHRHRRKFSVRRKISNMFNYLIMENKGEIVNMKLDVDYFQHQ